MLSIYNFIRVEELISICSGVASSLNNLISLSYLFWVQAGK
jgi:hypothetical protein